MDLLTYIKFMITLFLVKYMYILYIPFIFV